MRSLACAAFAETEKRGLVCAMEKSAICVRLSVVLWTVVEEMLCGDFLIVESDGV
jgi:hypothetical protein